MARRPGPWGTGSFVVDQSPVATFRGCRLGQWGLMLLPPANAAKRTAGERVLRPNAYRAGDIIIGEFLGDQELLVFAPSEVNRGQVLIALPMDDRPDWPLPRAAWRNSWSATWMRSARSIGNGLPGSWASVGPARTC